MPSIKLTQPAVDRLKPPRSGRVEYWDKQLPAFGLRISSAGRRSWVVMYRVDGKLVRQTLGTIAATPSVADARELARESLRKAQADTNPIEQRRAQERAQAREAANTFRAVADSYIERYAKHNTKESTWRELQRQLVVDVYPAWGERPIREITRRDVIELLDGIADRGAPVQANRTLARLRTLFNWAVDRDIIAANPFTRLRMPTVERPRSRTLTDDEVRWFWDGCTKLGWPFGPMGQLLLVTAQRRTEVAGMRWREIDRAQRLWIIPRERAKNDREHAVHLSDLAMEIIDALPQFAPADAADWVFTTTGTTHVSGYSRAKARLDTLMLETMQEQLRHAGANESQATIEEWIFHDLRRTAATGMAKLNSPPHVVDRVLNHVSGTIRGVAAVYNRHAYLDERKTALDAWSRYLENILRPVPANVVPISSARGGS